MATVNLEKMTKVYPNGKPAVLDLDLDVAEGELMVLVGPSGSGKTTALRMVAGLEDITSGTLRMGGKVVNDLAPKDRNVAMVFQSYALYPHMTVAENIGFSLKLRKVPKSEVQAKVKSAAALLGLTDYLDRKPSQLSGGQRQRVAMGRAIVREPSVFLMDEPLSNLDAKMRVQMRAEISRIQRRVGVATFYVTHDQTEAMTMGDRVAVLHMGELQQCDTPQYLYEHPNNLFVAAFIGSPAMNLYEAIISPEADAVRVGSQTLALAETQLQARPALRGYRDRKVIIGIRPEDLDDPALGPPPPPAPPWWPTSSWWRRSATSSRSTSWWTRPRPAPRSPRRRPRPRSWASCPTCRWARPRPKGWPASRPAATSGPAPGSPSWSVPNSSTSSTPTAAKRSGTERRPFQQEFIYYFLSGNLSITSVYFRRRAAAASSPSLSLAGPSGRWRWATNL